MPDATSARTHFVENLPLIERVAGMLARRMDLSGDDAADFTSWAKLRLMEANYAVLRRFRGHSTIGAYLTVALSMLARDLRLQRRGR